MAEIEREPYSFPMPLSDMTIHHAYGFTEPGDGTVAGAFSELGFGFVQDLLQMGRSREEVAEMINKGKLDFAHWPERKPVTDLVWDERPGTAKALDKLANVAVGFCYGQDENQAVGGNFATVGAEMGSQQFGLVGLIYARHKGRLREVPELGQPATGPLYIVRHSFSEKMVKIMLPELLPDDQE